MALRIYAWGRILTQAVHVLASTQLGEPALLQSRLGINARSAEAVLAWLHRYGFVGPANRHSTRDVLITSESVPDVLAVITAEVPTPPTATRLPATGSPATGSTGTGPRAVPARVTISTAGPATAAPPGPQAIGEQPHVVRPASAALVARMRALQQRASQDPTAGEGDATRPAAEPGVPGRERLLQLHADAVAIYRRHLADDTPAAHAARLYMTRRGLPSDSDRWQIGYAPPSWYALTDELRAIGYTDEELVDSGLCARGQYRVHDRFSNRIMFPITNSDGAAIGFLGRLPIDKPAENAGPKYLNSPTTILYSKGRHLFGYGHDPTGTPELGAGAIILVEGPIDVIAVHQAADDFEAAGRAGPQHRPLVLAACGTAFTAEHIDTLRALAPGREIISALDPDAAGVAATVKLAELLRDWDGPTTAATFPPGGGDPATVYQNGGADLLYQCLRERRSLLDLVLDAQVQRSPDLTSVEGQVLAGERVARVLVERKVVSPELDRQLWRLADAYDLPRDVLVFAWCEAMEKPPSGPSTGPPPADPVGHQVDQRKAQLQAQRDSTSQDQHPRSAQTAASAMPAVRAV
jgi:DNA primase catalytic core